MVYHHVGLEMYHVRQKWFSAYREDMQVAPGENKSGQELRRDFTHDLRYRIELASY
jgi:hypothetical protein